MYIQSVRFLEPKIWTVIPQNIISCNYLQEFKRLIEVWKPEVCPRGMCKNALQILALFDKTHTFH